MNNRISMVLKAKNISPAQLADDLGVQRSGISHILNGRNKPSLDFIQKLIRLYPDISMQWLLFGEGPMMNPYPGREAEPVKRDTEVIQKPKPVMMELFADETTDQEKYPVQQKEKTPEHNIQTTEKQPDETGLKDQEMLTPQRENSNEPASKEIKPGPGVKIAEKSSGMAMDAPVEEIVQKVTGFQVGERKLVKIVMFYSDKTFAEFLPEM